MDIHNLKEELRKSHNLAYFIEQEFKYGNIGNVIDTLKKHQNLWLIRKLLDVVKDKDSLHQFCLYIEDSLQYCMTLDDYNKYFNELIEVAIFNEYPIVKELLVK